MVFLELMNVEKSPIYSIGDLPHEQEGVEDRATKWEAIRFEVRM